MRAEDGRIFEMGTRVGSFSDGQPDTDKGHNLSVQRVKEAVEEMQAVATAQREGLVDKRAGSAERARLRREILAGPVAHMAEVGRRASRSGHEVGETYRYRPSAQTYVAFRTAVGAMQSAAEAGKEELIPYGLSEAVLAQLGVLLSQYDAAALRINAGRTAHKGATKQLNDLASEIASVVRTMDARNRLRFQDNRQLLESWISASTVLGRRGSSEPVEPPAAGPVPGSEQGRPPEAGGEVRPAA